MEHNSSDLLSLEKYGGGGGGQKIGGIHYKKKKGNAIGKFVSCNLAANSRRERRRNNSAWWIRITLVRMRKKKYRGRILVKNKSFGVEKSIFMSCVNILATLLFLIRSMVGFCRIRNIRNYLPA